VAPSAATQPDPAGPATSSRLGESQAGSSQANWNLVSLSVPEPSVFSLLFIGSGVLIYFRNRNKKHSAPAKSD
jgi:hypothetical protein